MHEYGERLSIQDQKLNTLVREGIFQPFSGITNPFHSESLAYRNPYLTYTNSQFDFHNGLPSQLPYMLALGENKKHPNALVYCRPHNLRTGIISSSSGIYLDNIPLTYLDEKGLGLLYESRTLTSPIRRDYVSVNTTCVSTATGKPITYGLTNIDWALHDAKSTDDLMFDGLRIIPTVAVVEIQKIFDECGKYISCEEAIQKGLLADHTTPAIQFRAFVTPYRPYEFIFTQAHELPEKELHRRRTMFLEAMGDMSKDPSIPIDFSDKKNAIPAYLKWFAVSFGQNLARLHGARKVHRWLHELHNTTLDVRIIDSDGLETNVSDEQIEDERDFLFFHYPDSPSILWKYYDSVRTLFHLSIHPDILLAHTIHSYKNEF